MTQSRIVNMMVYLHLRVGAKGGGTSQQSSCARPGHHHSVAGFTINGSSWAGTGARHLRLYYEIVFHFLLAGD